MYVLVKKKQYIKQWNLQKKFKHNYCKKICICNIKCYKNLFIFQLKSCYIKKINILTYKDIKIYHMKGQIIKYNKKTLSLIFKYENIVFNLNVKSPVYII